MKKWNILNNQKTYNIKHITEDEVIKILLKNRGLTKKKDIEEFLNPDLAQVTAEKLNIKKKELSKAVARIKKAISDKESIVVYTDYDVDGVCAGAIIWETLHKMGAKIMPYVPHRVEEGYGLSEKGIEAVIKLHKPSLIITVDHGVTAAEKVKYLASRGIDTIIIDHHLIPKKVPRAIALVHTTYLCATGVAWFFANVLKGEKSDETTSNLDLVALATIADLIPLVGPSRTLVTFGLKELNKTKRIGLLALIDECGLQKGDIGVYEIGHILAPRINAMGRITHAIEALRLLCTRDKDRAKDLAKQLVQTNSDRQIQTSDSILLATEIVKKQLIIKENQSEKLIFISEERFTQGVIGLVASRLVDSYYLPAIVISEGKEYSKASARSIAGFNIVEAINKASDLLVDVGGHPMAAGFTIETRNLTKLREKLMSIVAADLPTQLLTRVINIDLLLKLNDITDSLYKTISKLSPFGVGNPEPVFVTEGVSISGARLVGRDKKHLKLFIKQADTTKTIEAIGFGMGPLYPSLNPSTVINIVYNINEDRWNGNNGLQLKLKDVKIREIDI